MSEHIFFGEESREFWEELNRIDAGSTGDDIRDFLFSLCCKLQELEQKIEEKS